MKKGFLLNFCFFIEYRFWAFLFWAIEGNVFFCLANSRVWPGALGLEQIRAIRPLVEGQQQPCGVLSGVFQEVSWSEFFGSFFFG